jgi:metallo-beta-lactamase class B
MKTWVLFVVLLLSSFVPKAQKKQKINEDILVRQLSPKVYLHISTLKSQDFGNVLCNGLIYISNHEAVIIDTPPDTAQTVALLDWLTQQFPGTKIKAVIVTHFHLDCLGGLPVFHERGILSYGYQLTPELAIANHATPPEHTFYQELSLYIGGEKVQSRYFGEAHTRDNIVVWIPSEKILFGGCMVKAQGSEKGNLADANQAAWSRTVTNVKNAFPYAKLVVPGHGKTEDTSLLNYTISLFQR